jgi:uncharacterized sodium:solute symporter family permease YidK
MHATCSLPRISLVLHDSHIVNHLVKSRHKEVQLHKSSPLSDVVLEVCAYLLSLPPPLLHACQGRFFFLEPLTILIGVHSVIVAVVEMFSSLVSFQPRQTVLSCFSVGS